MPTDIQTGAITAGLVRLFGVKGRFRPQLDDVVVPVALVGDISRDPELDVKFAIATSQVAAVVGDDGRAVLFNGTTADTGVLLEVFRIEVFLPITAAAAVNCIIRQTTNAPIAPAAGSTLSKAWSDQGQPGVPAGSVFADTGAFAGQFIGITSLAAGERAVFEMDQVLAPFTAIAVAVTTNNQAFDVVFHYRQRRNADL